MNAGVMRSTRSAGTSSTNRDGWVDWYSPKMRRRVLDAAFADARVNYRIFFPHALRGLRGLEPSLTWLPLGAQYYVRASK